MRLRPGRRPGSSGRSHPRLSLLLFRSSLTGTYHAGAWNRTGPVRAAERRKNAVGACMCAQEFITLCESVSSPALGCNTSAASILVGQQSSNANLPFGKFHMHSSNRKVPSGRFRSETLKQKIRNARFQWENPNRNIPDGHMPCLNMEPHRARFSGGHRNRSVRAGVGSCY